MDDVGTDGIRIGIRICWSLNPPTKEEATNGARPFREELAARWHCVLRLELPRWPLQRDTLSVGTMSWHDVSCHDMP